jgi:hypothetical protein
MDVKDINLSSTTLITWSETLSIVYHRQGKMGKSNPLFSKQQETRSTKENNSEKISSRCSWASMQESKVKPCLSN